MVAHITVEFMLMCDRVWPSSRTVLETISIDHCSEGWLWWTLEHSVHAWPAFTAVVEANVRLLALRQPRRPTVFHSFMCHL